MAKIVSAVPKLITNTIGILAAAPPKPAPVPLPPPAPATPDPAAPDADKPGISGPDLSEDLNALTDRNRGRLGTIATSFRGVLNDSSNTLSRRTLLGE